MDIEPFIGGRGAFFANFFGVVGWDSFENIINVVDAESVAGAKDGCGVVGVVDVFENNR